MEMTLGSRLSWRKLKEPSWEEDFTGTLKISSRFLGEGGLMEESNIQSIVFRKHGENISAD